jgi:hypothetical protein
LVYSNLCSRFSGEAPFERHPGTARQVAWPRLKVTLSRDAAYRKLLTAGALFSQDMQPALKPGEVQAWLSAFLRDPSQVEACGKKWERLEEIYQS